MIKGGIFVNTDFWKNLNIDLTLYCEFYLLPRLLSYALYKLACYEFFSETFENYYNSIKSYLDLTNINDELVIAIASDILRNKYNLEIASFDPLVIKNTSSL